MVSRAVESAGTAGVSPGVASAGAACSAGMVSRPSVSTGGGVSPAAAAGMVSGGTLSAAAWVVSSGGGGGAGRVKSTVPPPPLTPLMLVMFDTSTW